VQDEGSEALGFPTGEGRRLTLAVPEAARLLGISRTSAYEATHRGELPLVQIGRRMLVPYWSWHPLPASRPCAARRVRTYAQGRRANCRFPADANIREQAIITNIMGDQGHAHLPRLATAGEVGAA
jgi:excisionase family DNA binding protein